MQTNQLYRLFRRYTTLIPLLYDSQTFAKTIHIPLKYQIDLWRCIRTIFVCCDRPTQWSPSAVRLLSPCTSADLVWDTTVGGAVSIVCLPLATIGERGGGGGGGVEVMVYSGNAVVHNNG